MKNVLTYSGFHGHHPLAMAAMYAATSGVSPGGFFANPLGQAPPGCLVNFFGNQIIMLISFPRP